MAEKKLVDERDYALARHGYEAYCKHSDYKSPISGVDLPQWDALEYSVRDAWKYCTDAVVRDVFGLKTHLPFHMQAHLFKMAFKDAQKEVHDTAKEKGWWDKDRNNAEMIALMHSELSEALRHGNPPDDKIPAFTGVEAELADTVIRIMDMADARGYDVAGAIVEKMQMNKGRERMHGGKAF